MKSRAGYPDIDAWWTQRRQARTSGVPLSCPQVIASWHSLPPELGNSEQLVGGKAMGLLRLPRDWVPTLIVLTAAFHKAVLQQGDAAASLESLPGPDRELFAEFMRMMLSQGAPSHLLVRSNAPNEDLSSRGAFFSIAIDPTLSEVGRAVNQILRLCHPEPMCVILQAAVEPGVLGHMSNERRVSQKRTRWLVEGLGTWGPTPRAVVLAAARATPALPLMASTESEVSNCLRAVARHLSDLNPGYFHCEWVWNGRRLWIVQCDKATSQLQHSEVDEYLRAKARPVPTFGSLPHIVHFTAESTERWKKLNRPKTFASLRMPVADVFVVSGDKWCERESRGRIAAGIAEMCRVCPVVVRCDISQEAKVEEILLPTSPATQDAEKLLHFMDKTAKQFETKNVAPSDWAFLLAFLVPARASAMVHARPKAERVRVDTNWGFPDGLSFFPHDSWFYYPADGRVSEKRRFKGVCLMPEEAGWIPRTVGPPFDWQPVLNEPEVKMVATWALQLADHLDCEVQLMALARIGNTRGPAGCLPWHYTTWEVLRYAESLRMLPPRSTLEVISSREDLHLLRRGEPRANLRGYYVRPATELLRDDAFLEDAAKLATSHNRPIYFEGSVLGHAYYVMTRAGAAVVPVNEDEPEDLGKRYNKLVRDKIPLIIRRGGGLARVRHVSQAEARELLRQKLIEEAFEVRNCSDSQLVEELADVLEVADSLRSHSAIAVEELDCVHQHKRTKRGGFDQAVYLESTGLESLRLPSDSNGCLPLFQMEETLPSKQRRLPVHSQVTRESVEDGRYLARLSISLIPPAAKTEQPIEIVAESLDATIEVRYAESKVFVSIARIPRDDPVHQLSLFPNLVDEGPS